MRYSTDDMRNYAADTKFDFGVKFAMKEAADEIDRLRRELTRIQIETTDSVTKADLEAVLAQQS